MLIAILSVSKMSLTSKKPVDILKASVMITNTAETRGGTGFHVKAPSGKIYILTNKHICRLADENDVLLIRKSTDARRDYSKESKEYFRKVIRRYPLHDLCLVESIQTHHYVKVSPELKVGSEVVLIGHPGLRALTISKGHFIAKVRINLFRGFGLPVLKLIANNITTIGYGGNSGSMVVNDKGSLVGVMFAGSRSAITDMFMVPLNVVKRFLRNY